MSPVINGSQPPSDLAISGDGLLRGHWTGTRGIRSALLVSLVGVQGTLLCVSLASTAWINSLADPRHVILVIGAMLTLALPIEAWAWTGVFRAGVRCGKEGRRWTGVWAQVIAFAGYIGMSMAGGLLVVLANALQSVIADSNGLTPASVLADTDHWVVHGDITWDTADRIRAALARRTPIELRVTSRGGSMGAGLLIAHHLRMAGLARLVIDGRCASACTTLFEAAPERILVLGSTIAAHSPFFPPTASAVGPTYRIAAREKLRQSYRRAGITSAWIDRALATPFSSYYQPHVTVLVQEHVVHRVITPDGEQDARTWLVEAGLMPVT